MAKAHVVRQVVREPKSRRRVVLVLTEGEADFLINQCYRVRGDRRLSPVKYAVRIRGALQRAVGYKWADCDARVLSGGIVRFSTYDQLTHRKIARLKAEAQEALSEMSWDENLTSGSGPVHLGGATMRIPALDEVSASVGTELPETPVEPGSGTVFGDCGHEPAPTIGSVASQAVSGLLGVLRARLG